MVSKSFCDRCGKEFKLGTQSYIKINDIRLTNIGDGNLEVCLTCKKDILRFLGREGTV